MVTLNAVPAVWVLGVGTEKAAAPAGFTVKLDVFPVIVLWVTVNVVDWASVRVSGRCPRRR